MNTGWLATALVLAALAGCSRDDDKVGPAQRAGQALDKAGANVSRDLERELSRADRAAAETRKKLMDATDDASQGLRRVTERAGKKMEDAGARIRDAAGRGRNGRPG
jgi:hypothetical protein